MKILLAIDGSNHSKAVVNELVHRSWPADTEVRILSVAHPSPYFLDPFLIGAATHFDSLKEEHDRAENTVTATSEEIARRAPDLKVTTQVLHGSPKDLIAKEAGRWGSDLILMGSRGHGPVGRLFLGTVTQAVITHAPCAVEIVCTGAPAAA
ncbi:MAG TPA: universal stress protein [Acidobacteriaceae bacterium]|nr:universal stress protein [Acidobacteriaceae bacterium]